MATAFEKIFTQELLNVLSEKEDRKMQTEFHTNKYEAAHGRAPKDSERGMWILIKSDSAGRYSEPDWSDPNCPDYFEAGKMVELCDMKEAAREQFPEVMHWAVAP